MKRSALKEENLPLNTRVGFGFSFANAKERRGLYFLGGIILVGANIVWAFEPMSSKPEAGKILKSLMIPGSLKELFEPPTPHIKKYERSKSIPTFSPE